MQMEAVRLNISKCVSWAESELTRTEQLLACAGSVKRDYGEAAAGLCETALSGAGLGLVALLLLGLSLFLLLACLSKAWHLYTKRPMDYVEVEDEDPFLPRGAGGFRTSSNHSPYDSTIPADFYGTHVYNPRTRFLSRLPPASFQVPPFLQVRLQRGQRAEPDGGRGDAALEPHGPAAPRRTLPFPLLPTSRSQSHHPASLQYDIVGNGRHTAD